jgi:multidrug efflux pump
MQGDNLTDLLAYAPRMLQQLRQIPIITDVSSDQQNHGLQALVNYDRDEAARYGITPSLIDASLYDAFGQRQVSTMYRGQNQYHVIMEVAPEYWQSATTLNDLFVRSPQGAVVPLSAFASWAPAVAPRSPSTTRGSSRR